VPADAVGGLDLDGGILSQIVTDHIGGGGGQGQPRAAALALVLGPSMLSLAVPSEAVEPGILASNFRHQQPCCHLFRHPFYMGG